MPTVYGYKIRWVVDEEACTECGAPYEETWCMVSVVPGNKLLCRDCLQVWRAQEKAECLVGELFRNAPRLAGRRQL